MAGGAADAFDLYIIHAGPGSSTTVGQHRGWRSTEIDGTDRLAWELTPGVVVNIITRGVDRADVDRIASSVGIVSDADWERLLASVGAVAVSHGAGDGNRTRVLSLGS